MTWKDGGKIIAYRRDRVAQLLVRGLRVREIAQVLAEQGIVNPETQKPFGLGTIGRDCKALKAQWLANAARSVAEHKAEHFAEIEEVKRAAWAKGRLDIVLRAMEHEAKVLGLYAPVKQEISGPGGAAIEVKHDFSDEQLAEIARVLAECGALGPAPGQDVDAEAK